MHLERRCSMAVYYACPVRYPRIGSLMLAVLWTGPVGLGPDGRNTGESRVERVVMMIHTSCTGTERGNRECRYESAVGMIPRPSWRGDGRRVERGKAHPCGRWGKKAGLSNLLREHQYLTSALLLRRRGRLSVGRPSRPRGAVMAWDGGLDARPGRQTEHDETRDRDRDMWEKSVSRVERSRVSARASKATSSAGSARLSGGELARRDVDSPGRARQVEVP